MLSFSTYLGDGFEPSGDHKHETIMGLVVDASTRFDARGRSASPSPYFFGNTSPATTVNGFQTACESCTVLSTALDDVVVFLLKSWQPALKNYSGQPDLSRPLSDDERNQTGQAD